MPQFSRILLKLSGEILRDGHEAFAPDRLRPVASAIAEVRGAGVQVGGRLEPGEGRPEEIELAAGSAGYVVGDHHQRL